MPDYAPSNLVESVYVDACCAIILGSKSLSFLAEGQELSRDPSSRLPSWVPDWRIEQGRVALADRHYMKDTVPAGVSDMQIMSTAHRFCAGDEMAVDVWEAADIKFEHEPIGRVLHTNVLVIDTIENVMEPNRDWSSWMSARGDAPEFCKTHRAKKMAESELPRGRQEMSRSHGKAEMASPTGVQETSDSDSGYKETIKDWEEQWKSEAELEPDRDLAFWWQGDMQASEDTNYGDDSDFYAIDNAIYCTFMLSDDAYGAEDEWERAKIKDDVVKGRRRFFLTQSNTMGMGPPRSKEGDLVSIFLGCSCPLIIRKQNDRYFFVGEAFVKGWMYGKAVYEWDLSCLGQRELTRIALF